MNTDGSSVRQSLWMNGPRENYLKNVAGDAENVDISQYSFISQQPKFLNTSIFIGNDYEGYR